MSHAAMLLNFVLVATPFVVAAEAQLNERISEQWQGTDRDRMAFVHWVNEHQPFVGLSAEEVLQLLGEPTSVYDNQEHPYNGLDARFDDSVVSSLQDGQDRPVIWEYQTLRAGSEESEAWSGEGSGYLLDLVIHFNIHGRVYGCGTVQFTTGGDYYDLLRRADD